MTTLHLGPVSSWPLDSLATWLNDEHQLHTRCYRHHEWLQSVGFTKGEVVTWQLVPSRLWSQSSVCYFLDFYICQPFLDFYILSTSQGHLRMNHTFTVTSLHTRQKHKLPQNLKFFYWGCKPNTWSQVKCLIHSLKWASSHVERLGEKMKLNGLGMA